MTFGGQVAAVRNATLLIGVHGAGLTNLMFLPTGAAVVEILPWHWERHAYERMSAILGYTYGKWANADRAATVFPEEITWKHFPATSEEDREIIRTADSKPMNLRGQAGSGGREVLDQSRYARECGRVCRRRAKDAQRVATERGIVAATRREDEL
jgi:hypothetical protein